MFVAHVETTSLVSYMTQSTNLDGQKKKNSNLLHAQCNETVITQDNL